jgi:hypothetical protein
MPGETVKSLASCFINTIGYVLSKISLLSFEDIFSASKKTREKIE